MLDSQAEFGQTGKDTKAVVRATYGPLLEILEDETVSVIHHSFTEFLNDAGRASRPTGVDLHAQFPIIDSRDAHKSMGLTCLIYLSSGCLKDWKITERTHEANFHNPRKNSQQGIKTLHSFLDYAMHNWYFHIRKAGPLDGMLLEQPDAFMSIGSPDFRAWLDMCWGNTYELSKISLLYVVAWAGMPTYVQHILEREDESNGRDNCERTPL